MGWRGFLGVCGAAGAFFAIASACGSGGSSGGGAAATDLPPLALAPAFGGLAFTNPVKLVQHPGDADRWYVVEQGGLVHSFLASDPGGTRQVAADVDALVDLGDTTSSEQGLLSLAFAPDFAVSGEVYLSYTDEAADDSVLARWESGDGVTFAPSADPIVLAVPHPRSNHNGGDLGFGRDGFLYYSLGDGGGAGDPDENGQDTTTLLGAILRLDVTSPPPPGRDYAIPPTNPFAASPHCDTGSGAAPCPELFAWGLRNPWRFSFDLASGALRTGDVGQSSQEEIDLVVLGGNYGWDCREGELDYEPEPACNTARFVAPEAVHGRSDARSITGGVVYRGSGIRELDGYYVYGDFLTGRIFAFDTRVADAPVVRLGVDTSVSAFGQGRDGEVYLVGFGTPSIQMLVRAGG